MTTREKLSRMRRGKSLVYTSNYILSLLNQLVWIQVFDRFINPEHKYFDTIVMIVSCKLTCSVGSIKVCMSPQLEPLRITYHMMMTIILSH